MAAAIPNVESTTSLYWAFRIWSSSTKTVRKNRKIKANLRLLSEDLQLIAGVGVNETSAEVSAPSKASGSENKEQAQSSSSSSFSAASASNNADNAGDSQTTTNKIESDKNEASGEQSGNVAETAETGNVDGNSGQDKTATKVTPDNSSEEKRGIQIHLAHMTSEISRKNEYIAELELKNNDLQLEVGALRVENEEGAMGLDRALETMQNMQKMKNKVIINVEKARKSLSENASFCFHNSNAEKYLDFKAIEDERNLKSQNENAYIHYPLRDKSGFAIPRVDFREITALQFVRDFYGKNRPCIFTNVYENESDSKNNKSLFGSFSSLSTLKSALSGKLVNCNFTPAGLGDAVIPVPVFSEGNKANKIDLFVKPLEKEILFDEFAELLLHGNENLNKDDFLSKDKSPGFKEIYPELNTENNSSTSTPSSPSTPSTTKNVVPYMSLQNDCLRKEDNLRENLDFEFFKSVQKFASEAFGTNCEALNIWCGDERSTSSFHKDPYENLYLVTSGEKIFWLAPPTSTPCFYESEFDSATYAIDENSGKWKMSVEEGCKTPWIPVNINGRGHTFDELVADFPKFKDSSAVEVHLKPNEMLYLPSLWFHAATQSEPTIAINCWHDMTIDQRFVYQEYLKGICNGGGK